MPTIPVWLLGKNVTAVSITGQALTGATLADSGSAVALLAKTQGINHSITPELQEINSMNSTRQNNVILSDGFQFTINCLMVNDGTDPAPLRTLVNTFDYLKVVFTKGSGGSAETYTAYCVRGAYNEDMQGRGAGICSLVLEAIDAGSSTLVVS